MSKRRKTSTTTNADAASANTASANTASANSTSANSASAAPQPQSGTLAKYAPGVILCLAAAGMAYLISLPLTGINPMIIAIALGIIAANTAILPQITSAGIDFSAKKLLRVGIIFLGLQLVLQDIFNLGAPILLVIVGIVAGGLLGTILLGKILRVPAQLSLLIACGFSICGAAAVAGSAGVTDPEDKHEEDTVTAVALVVIFGTVMIPLVPLVAPLIGLNLEQSGMWAGGSIHEIAQVVAVGGIIGGSALGLAVIVKLARVLLLAPVMAILSLQIRRKTRAALAQAGSDPQAASSQGKLPPLVPPFIVGFLAMVLLRSFLQLPQEVLSGGQILQTALLSAAMFGLGCGVKIKKLLGVGLRPFVLAALSTILVAAIAYCGVLLVA